jgi:hypothetical protein
MVDQTVLLGRRAVYEQCNFTFPLVGSSEFEANPVIVRGSSLIIVHPLTLGYRQELV